MKIVGLTGGIGTGKTTVSHIFQKYGYEVYNADLQAKKLMVENMQLKQAIIRLMGEEAYVGDNLNKKWIAEKIFSDKELLKQQNVLVHAAVKKDFESWVKMQNTSFCVKEASILFESGSYKACDYTIVVTALEETRIQRAMSRDGATAEEIKKRIAHQWSQEKLVELADFQIINNSDLKNLEIQVKKIIKILEKLSQ